MRGARVRWFAAGSGSALVLVHGLGGAASNWVDLAPALARRYRVVVPELPGHGRSEPLPAPPTLRQFAERVARVAELEGLARYVVVGHSLGGLVAVRTAVLRREAVAGLVLAGAAGIASSTRRARHALRIAGVVKPGRVVAPFRHAVARRPRLRRLVFGGWGAYDPLVLSPAAVVGLLAGPSAYTDLEGAAAALGRDDPRLDLGLVGCPALVVWGARDVQLPIDDAFEYTRRLRAQLRVIPACGHLLICERPDACLDAIDDFVGRL